MLKTNIILMSPNQGEYSFYVGFETAVKVK